MASWALAACGSPITRGTRIEFFPPIDDDALQVASVETVGRVLRHHGATIVASTGSEVLASVPLECPRRDGGVAEFRFTRSAGPQAVAVRFCPERGVACVDGSPDVPPAGPCADDMARLLSSIEQDLTESLLGKVAIATPHERSRWEDLSLESLFSLVSMRRWVTPDFDRDSGWRRPSGSAVGATPPRSGRRLAALEADLADAGVVPVRNRVVRRPARRGVTP